MQRHRAGRLAVLINLNKIDSKPNGVVRTTCVQPGATELQGNGMTPSPSETWSSENLDASSQSQLVSGGGHGSPSRSDTTVKRNQGEEEDSGLKMSTDITQAASVLRRLEGINEEQCSSASDDSGIQMRGTAAAGVGPLDRLGASKSPSHDDGGGICAAPPCGVEPSEAGCDGSCEQDAARRTPSAAQLLRCQLNDYPGT